VGLPAHLVYQNRTVLLKYHRLLSGTHRFPPNSVSALRHLIAEGAAVVEFDVSLTGDGAFVLLHDTTLERETTGVGPLQSITREQFTALRLRGSEEPPATLEQVVSVLRDIARPIKVQVDLKTSEPLMGDTGARLLESLAPLRANAHIRVVVGCLADWNLRALHRLDPALRIGLDFLLYLDAPVDDGPRLPMRVNAYGYLDDHPLGYRRVLSTAAYLEDRVEVLLRMVDETSEVYLRKEFVLQALGDGFNPIEFVHTHRPGALVDVWTLYAEEPQISRTLWAVLDAGADQISSPSCALLAHLFERERHGPG
jgi:glycerophosphoryl diester phosphodiesterase